MLKSLVATSLLLASTTVLALEPWIGVTPANDPAQGVQVFFTGPVTSGSVHRLAAVLESQAVKRGSVVFNATGDDLDAGIRLGLLIREHGLSTQIAKVDPQTGELKPGVCYSACLLAYAGGVERHLFTGSEAATYKHFASTSKPADAEMAAKAAEHFTRMGVSADVVGLMRSAPSTGLGQITEAQAKALSLAQAGQ